MIADGDFCYIDGHEVNGDHSYKILSEPCPCDECNANTTCKIECFAFKKYYRSGKWEEEDIPLFIN